MQTAREIAKKYLEEVGIEAPTIATLNLYEDCLTEAIRSYGEAVREAIAERVEKLPDSALFVAAIRSLELK